MAELENQQSIERVHQLPAESQTNYEKPIAGHSEAKADLQPDQGSHKAGDGVGLLEKKVKPQTNIKTISFAHFHAKEGV